MASFPAIRRDMGIWLLVLLLIVLSGCLALISMRAMRTAFLLVGALYVLLRFIYWSRRRFKGDAPARTLILIAMPIVLLYMWLACDPVFGFFLLLFALDFLFIYMNISRYPQFKEMFRSQKGR